MSVVEVELPSGRKAMYRRSLTGHLRFVMRNGARILQQQWVDVLIDKPTYIERQSFPNLPPDEIMEWRDVPLVEDEMA